MRNKIALVIGAGPAGLTAAYELLEKTKVKPIVIEKSTFMGGIARTINYKGNRIDIGGHRFFSKSDRVMKWWLTMLPLQKVQNPQEKIAYQGQTRDLGFKGNADPNKTDKVMLLRPRKSRIYYTRKFFDYPITLSKRTLENLGSFKAANIGFSYMKSTLFPIKPEITLEDFFINRFGKELYLTFFKSYTEKVWGVPCNEISAEWGAQRVKGLSISKAILHYLKKWKVKEGDVSQKDTETSLIEQFLYPKFGPGQMWEAVAKKVENNGGKIITESVVDGITLNGNKIQSISFLNIRTKKRVKVKTDFVFSTMPIKELIKSMKPQVPGEIKKISEGLIYRDFITVGLLLKKIKIKESDNTLVKDNWIYIQEDDVKVGRLQIFNNWSPYLVENRNNVWIGLEYFCNEGDELWTKPEEEMKKLAVHELQKIGIIDSKDVLDSTVIKMEKTYPAYFGEYKNFSKIRAHLDKIENLFLIGRNGMHRYNNQDHSMLTAMTSVENIINGVKSKDNIWAVNAEQEYHEEKSS